MNMRTLTSEGSLTFAATLLLATTALTGIFAFTGAVLAAEVTISTSTNQTVLLDPFQSGPSTVTVLSGVTVTAPAFSSSIIAQTAPWTVINSGTLSAAAAGRGALQLQLGGTVVNNQAAIINNAVGLGVNMYGSPSVVTNRGLITSVRSAVAIGEGNGNNIDGGSVINEAGGRISSQDASGIIYQDARSISVTNAGIIEGGRQGVLLWAGTVNNTGEIRSTNTQTFSHAITAAEGLATIINAGKITGSSFYAETGANAGAAGIGSVGIQVATTARGNITNSTGGEITGTILGIELLGSSSAITNSGVISSTRAGSGIFAQGSNNIVTNNATGRISASPNPPSQFAFLSSAVAITGANGTVVNSGLLQGRVLLATNGTVTNNASGRIEGNAAIFISSNPNLIDQSAGFSGTLTNAGTIIGQAGAATLTNTGSISSNVFGNTIVNAGTIGGGVIMTTGNDTLTLRSGSVIAGAINADAGIDSLILEGAGTAANVFSGFENLTMRGTEWTLSGASTFGAITVQSGFLNINGTLTGGPITLSAAGSGLRGSGRIENAVANTAGTMTPGGASTFGTLTVAGDYSQGTAGRLVIDANEAGLNDRLTVLGRATLGGVLQVAAVDGAWSVARTYTVLSAAGGLTGQFATLELNLPYLTPQLTYASNAVTLSLFRATADIQEDIVEETTEQQISTSTRKTTATVESRIDEVVTAAFPMVAPEGEEQASMLYSPSYGGVTSMAAGDEAAGWGAWATLTPTFVNQDLVLPGQSAAQSVKGETWDMFAGVDKLVGERAVVGALGGFEISDYDIKGSNGERKAEGPMLASYAGVILTDWLYATAQANHAWFSNKLTESSFGSAPVSGKFDSKRLTASVSMTARHEINRVKLSGKTGYSYTRESFDSYRASDGTTVTPDRSKLGRVTLGGEAAYRGETIMPYVNATFERDVSGVVGPGEREGFVFGGGARMMAERYSVDLYGNTETGRAGESATSFGLNVRMAF